MSVSERNSCLNRTSAAGSTRRMVLSATSSPRLLVVRLVDDAHPAGPQAADQREPHRVEHRPEALGLRAEVVPLVQVEAQVLGVSAWRCGRRGSGWSAGRRAASGSTRWAGPRLAWARPLASDRLLRRAARRPRWASPRQWTGGSGSATVSLSRPADCRRCVPLAVDQRPDHLAVRRRSRGTPTDTPAAAAAGRAAIGDAGQPAGPPADPQRDLGKAARKAKTSGTGGPRLPEAGVPLRRPFDLAGARTSNPSPIAPSIAATSARRSRGRDLARIARSAPEPDRFAIAHDGPRGLHRPGPVRGVHRPDGEAFPCRTLAVVTRVASGTY